MFEKRPSRKVLKIKCEGTQYVDFHILNEFQEDIKTITREDLDKLKESITTRGYIKPGFVWKHNKKLWILDMHQRKKALTELEKEGWYVPLIPIVEIFADTLEEAKDAVIVFTSQHGKLDESKLKIYIQKYQIKMQTLVIRNEPIKIELQQNKETKQDDEIPEDVKPITKMGDLWELGAHRVLCGEFPKDYKNDIKINWVITDPPYGINVVKRTIGGSKKNTISNLKKRKVGFDSIIKANEYLPIKNDDKPFNPEDLLKLAKNRIIFGGNYFASKLPDSPGWMIWDKNNGKEWKDTFADAEIIYTSCKIHSKIYRVLWKGMIKNEVGKRIHPTQKPIKLMSDLLKDFTKENAVCVDPYLGSGSTLIACEKTGRICYGIEIEPHYCDVIVKRYIDWCQKNNRPVSVKRNGKVFDIRRFNQ